jgi:hypothetical protein
VKLLDFATVQVGIACYALGLLMQMVSIDWSLSPELVWRSIEDRGLVRPLPAASGPLALCETCNLVAAIAGSSTRRPDREGRRRHVGSARSFSESAAIHWIARLSIAVSGPKPVGWSGNVN